MGKKGGNSRFFSKSHDLTSSGEMVSSSRHDFSPVEGALSPIKQLLVTTVVYNSLTLYAQVIFVRLLFVWFGVVWPN